MNFVAVAVLWVVVTDAQGSTAAQAAQFAGPVGGALCARNAQFLTNAEKTKPAAQPMKATYFCLPPGIYPNNATIGNL